MRSRATIRPDSDERQADRDDLGGAAPCSRCGSPRRRRRDVRRAAPIVTPPNTNAIELQGAELAAEIARLRERLRPADHAAGSRRAISFSSAHARSRSVSRRRSRSRRSSPRSPPPAAAAAARADRLRRPMARPRTAIISGFGELFLVKEGDAVTLALPRRSESTPTASSWRDRRQDDHPSDAAEVAAYTIRNSEFGMLPLHSSAFLVPNS